MHNIFKFEGRIEELEIYAGTLNAFGSTGTSGIASSAILSGVAESVSLASQSVYLASTATLDIHSVVMKVSGKICICQFHRALLKVGEYAICVGRQVGDNIYEVYSVLSPETGYMHMKVSMGAALKPAKKSVKQGLRVWYGILMFGTALAMFWARDFSLDTSYMVLFVAVVGYFIFALIVNSAFKSMIPFCEASECIFELYGFQNPEEVYLLTGRFISHEHKLWLESVYEYRNAVDFDPYPESYVKEKENRSELS
jgi:hypothetical protein